MTTILLNGSAMRMDFLLDGNCVVHRCAAEHARQAVLVAEMHCLQREFLDVYDLLR